MGKCNPRASRRRPRGPACSRAVGPRKKAANRVSDAASYAVRCGIKCRMMYGPCRYISRRFEQYAGTQLMLGIFGTHDRARVSVASFAHGPADGSNERERITRDSDVFMDVSSLSPSAVAEAVRQQRVDVLVDYDGAHQFNNLLVLAHRPAPVQARLYARSSATAQSRST